MRDSIKDTEIQSSTNKPEHKNSNSLGWLKLYIIGSDSSPSSRTVYIRRNDKIYAVLHTDTTGATKAVNLPADKVTGSEYTLILDNGDMMKVNVYPFVVNIHYIDR